MKASQKRGGDLDCQGNIPFRVCEDVGVVGDIAAAAYLCGRQVLCPRLKRCKNARSIAARNGTRQMERDGGFKAQARCIRLRERMEEGLR